MGVILGAWQLVYVAAAVPSGLLIDRIGPKRALAIGALIIALSAYLRTYAEGFWTLFAAVALFGLGGPIISIGLPKLVVDWFSGPSRGLASGIYITGPALGSVLVLSATHAIFLPLTGSWRMTLALYALIALLVAILWIVVGRDSPQGASDRTKSVTAGGYREVIYQPAVWVVIAIGFSAFLAGHGLRSWLPQVLEARGMSPTASGLLASLPAITGVFGSILILGLASRGGAGNRRRATMALLVVTGLSIAAINFVDGWPLVLAVAVEGFCAAAIQPLMLNILMEMPSVGPRRMGTAAGIFFSVGEVGGTLGPVVLGLLADLTGSFTPGLLVTAAVFWVMLGLAYRLRA
jgi:cyanate permease